jgi:flavin reductase (DIM6/NTAB) family NADH-FMN oxidoreductase RutF
MSKDPPPALDRQRLRAAYTSFATGVTVVATNDSGGRAWGMTASSFYSVSLDPPLVSISLTRDTPSFNAFVGSKEYSISILSAEQSALARHFATPVDDKFAGVEMETTGFESPVLAGTAAWLVCKPHEVHEIGDHTLLIGQVLAAGIHDRPPLVYHRGTFFALADQATEEVERLRQRGSTVGFIVEYDDAVALVPDPQAASGWTLPMGRLSGGRTNAEALTATATRLIGEPVEPDFLYSMIDVNDHLTCLVYRARLTQAPVASSNVRWVAVEDIPWDDVSTSKVVFLLQRYLEERVADQFGVFVNVGRGRIATITSEHEWSPDGPRD